MTTLTQGDTDMSKNETLATLNRALMTRRDELRRKLGAEMDDMAATSGGDSGEMASAGNDEEMASMMAEMGSAELVQVERALVQMQTGHYGKCEDCGLRINLERLKALPFTPKCIECQRASENNTYSSGRSRR